MSAKKYLRMPAAQTLAAKNESEERMMTALRKHVLYERQRKKQEKEAEVEEERLRKEREARERRNVMTLGETREKITALETRHRELQEKKQELFLTLKKLLNEDENRKKQQQKESNEMYAMQNLMSQQQQQANFMPPRPMLQQDRPQQGSSNNNNSGPPGSSSGGGGNSMHSRPGSSGSSGGPSGMSSQQQQQQNKRTRSPSPTQQHGHYYKGGIGGGIGSGGSGSAGQPYQHGPKDEQRRVEVGRAVLWNKPNPQQYPSGSMFYQPPPLPNNPSVDASGRGGHPPNFFPYSTIPSQHLRANYMDMAHMAAAAAGQKPPQDMGKMQMETMDYPPQPQGADRNLVAAYHHQQQQQAAQQQQQQQQQQQHQQQDRNKQQQPPHQQIVYDNINMMRWQQEQGKMPPGGAPASITRGYMKRGIND